MSILSYKDRGKWGNSRWRGNCSGHLYQDLFRQYTPSIFVDPMVGSGTSVEVAREMGIEAYGLDLHAGFNILRDSIIETVGKEADLVFSHPPYHDMVVYSGQQWGQAHPDDLSRCKDIEDFHHKMHVALLNQRAATRPGGLYGMLMGDLRRDGRYYALAAEAMARLPQDELVAVLIKAQHNCVSDARQYGRMRHPRILHEYVVLWERPRRILSMLGDLAVMATQASRRVSATWRAIVRNAMLELKGEASLQQLYECVGRNAPERLASNENWQAKVRQTLQLNPEFASRERGIWALAA